jgi:hypothetical protein
MELEGSLPFSQELATGRFAEPEKSGSQPQNLLFETHFYDTAFCSWFFKMI